MTSASEHPENAAINEKEKEKDSQKNQGDVVLDPHPSKALGELVTGGETNTPSGESSSKDA